MLSLILQLSLWGSKMKYEFTQSITLQPEALESEHLH